MRLKEDEEGLIEREELLKHWRLYDKTILDIGAGPLSIIAAKHFNCRVTNIDISESALRDARREAGAEEVASRITFELGDATSLRYGDASFDVVISYGALHHVDPERRGDFVREACRVARDKVIIAELNTSGFQRIHGSDSESRGLKAVDLEWLERELSSSGVLEKYTGTAMNVYVLILGDSTGAPSDVDSVQ